MPGYVVSGPAVLQETYTFAVEHPEVLSYLPCYCSCVYHGHTNNEDCFVDERLSDGNIVYYPHAST